MQSIGYQTRRGEVETYFDKTAAKAWSDLTSDAPVSGIRATVRAGRDRMRANILSWLPQDLSGKRVLDAGCGTGAFALEAANRGADVLAVDLSPKLVSVARDRCAGNFSRGSIDFIAGDLLDPALGQFDHVISMDALIHYEAPVAVDMLSQLAARTNQSIVFTFVPRTTALAVMLAVGRCMRGSGDRAPSINLVRHASLAQRIQYQPGLAGWECGRTERITSGFYTSQALEIFKR